MTDEKRNRGSDIDVLIVGAGPTGLFLALALVHHGVRILLVDRKEGPADHSRAMGVQARTLEFYRQFGLAEAAIGLGIKAGNAHFKVNGREAATFSLTEMGKGLSAYPFLLTLPQDVHERFLLDRLAKLGVTPRWGTSLTGFDQRADSIAARLVGPEATEELVSTRYLVGCDGGGSTTRQTLGIGFRGGTAEGRFYVADVDIGHESSDVQVGIGTDTLNLMMPVRTSAVQRLIGVVPQALAERSDLGFEHVRADAERLQGITVRTINWFSTYRVHHRVAERFRVGRAFIAGDAGHIHSPVGGQGMNTGLGDAMNLAWKLAEVIQGRARPGLLDTYEPERLAFARQLIATTDSAFGKMVNDGWWARLLRLEIAPRLVNFLTHFGGSKGALFKAISQTRISYPQSVLSEGMTGGVKSGDRMPYVAALDNHASLLGAEWRLHVYGEAGKPLADRAGELGVALTVMPFTDDVEAAGISRDAVYLLRPDGHVALALPLQDGEALTAYAARHGLLFGGSPCLPNAEKS